MLSLSMKVLRDGHSEVTLSIEAMVGGEFPSNPVWKGGDRGREDAQEGRKQRTETSRAMSLKYLHVWHCHSQSLVTESVPVVRLSPPAKRRAVLVSAMNGGQAPCTSQTSSPSPERRVDVSQAGSLGGGWCSLPCCQRPIASKC